jgi:hypothetical protein
VSATGRAPADGTNALPEHVFFWPAGQIQFKGITLGVQELSFRPEDAYKRDIRSSFEGLLTALKNERWEDHVFNEAVVLVERAAANMPAFGSLLPPEMRDAYRKAEANTEIIRRLRAKVHRSPALGDRKTMWFRVVRQNRDAVKLSMYSGKS